MVWPSWVCCGAHWKLIVIVVMMGLRIRVINRKSKIKIIIYYICRSLWAQRVSLQVSSIVDVLPSSDASLWRRAAKLRTGVPHRRASVNVSQDPLTNSWLPTHTSQQEIGEHRSSLNKQKNLFWRTYRAFWAVYYPVQQMHYIYIFIYLLTTFSMS
jgi:hypothetical protein